MQKEKKYLIDVFRVSKLSLNYSYYFSSVSNQLVAGINKRLINHNSQIQRKHAASLFLF